MDVEDESTKTGFLGVAGNFMECKESKNKKIHFNQWVIDENGFINRFKSKMPIKT